MDSLPRMQAVLHVERLTPDLLASCSERESRAIAEQPP